MKIFLTQSSIHTHTHTNCNKLTSNYEDEDNLLNSTIQQEFFFWFCFAWQAGAGTDKADKVGYKTDLLKFLGQAKTLEATLADVEFTSERDP